MTRAVIFDVDGVLIHGMHADPAHVRRWDTNLLADLGVDPARFVSEFIYDIFMKRVIIGDMSLVDALERRLPALGYRGSPLVFIDYWLQHDGVLNQPLIDAIVAFKSKADIRLYIATNQEHLRASWLWSHLGLNRFFEDIFYSARVGVQKPAPAYFDFIMARIGPQTEPPLFFDDSPKVIAGARAYGWEAVEYADLTDFTDHPFVASHI